MMSLSQAERIPFLLDDLVECVVERRRLFDRYYPSLMPNEEIILNERRSMEIRLEIQRIADLPKNKR